MLALRSIHRNFPHRKVWLGGYCPRWVNRDLVGYIPLEQNVSHWRNVLCIMDQVANHDEVTDTFTFFNDDFYVLSPVDGAPIWHEGTMEERAKRLKGLSLGEYSRGALQTLDLLKANGFANPWNYDLHIPIPMAKELVKEALALMPLPYSFWPHFRSIVGAVGNYEGVPGRDLKITAVATHIPPKEPFVSTSVRSLSAGQAGRELRRMFTETSPFEKSYKG